MTKINKSNFEDTITIDDVALYFNNNKDISEKFYNFIS